MEGLTSFAPLLLLLAAIGAFAGVIAGLLGVGGGIIIVPALYLVLNAIDLAPGISMHLAVGTSLATIIPTSLRSVFKHHARESVDPTILRRWTPGLLAGAVVGAALARIDAISGAALGAGRGDR